MQNSIIKALIGFLTGLINGVFGAGGGSILVPALQKYLNMETRKSHATSIAMILPLSIASSLIYLQATQVDLRILLNLSIGGLIGGFFGAKLLNKLSCGFLHKLFAIFMIVVSIRIFF